MTRQIRVGKLGIDLELRAAGMQYLEEVYGKPSHKIKFDQGRVTDFVHLLVALGLSTNPNQDAAELKRQIGRLDFGQIMSVIDKLEEATTLVGKGAHKNG